MRSPIAAALASVLVASPALASDASAPAAAQTLAMRDAIGLALQYAFPARIAQFREAAAAARVGEARVAFLPDLTAGVSHNAAQRSINQDYVFRDSDGNAIPASALPTRTEYGNTTNADVTASYLLFNTTRRLDLLAARTSRKGLAASTEDAKRSVIRETARAYLLVVQADALLRLAEQDLARRTRAVDEAEALVRGGKRADYEILRAKAELATSEASAIEARNGARIARATLAQVVGKELPIGFATVPPAPPADPRAGKSGADAARAIVPASLDRRPDIRAAGADAEIARLSFIRQERRYLPSLSVFASYNRLLDVTNEDLYDESYTWGGQLEIRFSDMLANRYRSHAARADARAARVVEDQTRVAASLEIERASLELDRAAEVSAATMKTLDATRRNYEVTSERYRLGVATQTERVDAEAALVEAEVNAAKSDVGYRIALWNLRYEMGESLDAP